MTVKIVCWNRYTWLNWKSIIQQKGDLSDEIVEKNPTVNVTVVDDFPCGVDVLIECTINGMARQKKNSFSNCWKTALRSEHLRVNLYEPASSRALFEF